MPLTPSVTVTLLMAAIGVLSAETAKAGSVPDGYRQVWSDEFASLSLCTGGPTYDGLEAGTGTWAAPGAWWNTNPKGVAGYGLYDWFVDPSYYGWPSGYPAQGQFAITRDGLRIRAEAPTPAMVPLLPSVMRAPVPWMTGQINSYHGMHIKPPFYFEARAKMPVAAGHPFPQIWLITGAHRYPTDHAMEYEIDVYEGFGESNRLHSALHWNKSPNKPDILNYEVVNKSSGVDLSTGFNDWGCQVTKEQQIFFFNGIEVGRVPTQDPSTVDSPYSIILDVSAGIPWKGGGPPSDGPHDMIVRYVRLYAPDANGITVK